MTAPSRAARVGITIALSLALLVLLAPRGVVATPSSWNPEIRTPRHVIQSDLNTAGIPRVTGVSQPRPKSESQAQAVSDAQVFAEAHPDAAGYPWLDGVTGSLKLSAADSAGADLLEGERNALAAGARSLKVAVRGVKFSMRDLTTISDDITTLQDEGVPDAGLIYSTSPDYESNRIVIRVSGASTDLFDALASRYGTEAIAVWIDPAGRGGSTLSRRDDVSPYYGGAKIGAPAGTCSNAFSWTIGTSAGNAMLTAAHCAPSGGDVSIGASTTIRGSITAGSEENWSTTTGTHYYIGQSTYRGDVALIRLKSTVTSAAQIWRGSPTSASHSTVAGRLARYSYPDENVFAGGQTKGETGPYHIDLVNTQWWYSNDGPSVVVKNIVTAPLLFPQDPFLAGGDSGGSVFRVNTNGTILAVGVISGIKGTSSLVFTDLYHTYVALPGDLNY